jgi:hypothetical protein
MFRLLKNCGAAVLSIACLSAIGAPAASAADMIETYHPPHVRHVARHVAHYHHHRHPVRVAYVRRNDRDCGPMIYEYRSPPPYTEVKLVCSPPWTGPRPSVY